MKRHEMITVEFYDGEISGVLFTRPWGFVKFQMVLSDCQFDDKIFVYYKIGEREFQDVKDRLTKGNMSVVEFRQFENLKGDPLALSFGKTAVRHSAGLVFLTKEAQNEVDGIAGRPCEECRRIIDDLSKKVTPDSMRLLKHLRKIN